MKTRSLIPICILAIVLLASAPLVQAQDNADVIYQTTFSTDPKWTTNNPSKDYWDADLGMYHFSLEPSTGNYAYIPVQYDRGSFRLEYDLILLRVDEEAAFRMGFSGTEMDPTKGPIVVNQFTNAKFGKIMWLQVVTNGAKILKVNSQNGDTLSSGPKGFYDGPTVKYELNKTYHVTTDYDSPNGLITMKVSEKMSGKDVWSYFVNIDQELHGMNRIYLGSTGDYGRTGVFATGYVDNVRLTRPSVTTPAPTTATTTLPAPDLTSATPKPTAVKTIAAVPTAPPETPESPSSPLLPVIALGIIGAIGLVSLSLRRRE